MSQEFPTTSLDITTQQQQPAIHNQKSGMNMILII